MKKNRRSSVKAPARIKPMLITIMRAMPPEFYTLMRAKRVGSVSDAIQYMLFTYEMLPTSPRSLVFDEKDVNRYMRMFASTYLNDQSLIDWDKVERDAQDETLTSKLANVDARERKALSQITSASGSAHSPSYLAVCRAQAKLHSVLLKQDAGNDDVRDAAVDVRDAWIEHLKEDAQ